MKLAYFVHDLTDPAVRRRVRMFQAGGAEPVVLGFRRTERAPDDLEGARVFDLGRTHDARLGQRALATAFAALNAGGWRGELAGVQAVVARTLEMLVVASAARRACGLAAPLTYECLDIHRLMLGEGVGSQAVRGVERALMKRAALLIVSSPAFLRAYFEPRQGLGRTLSLPTLLVENKVLELGANRPPPPPAPLVGPPWRIAWLGALRCRKSLEILNDLALRRPDLVEVSLHGRPSYVEFEDFDAQVGRLPNLTFRGPYAAEDLPRLYGQAHFAWSIDFMEEGMNSAWLLPNRVYEASRHGAVPIALAEVQTGRFLAERGIGLLLSAPAGLEARLEALNPADYGRLRSQLDAAPRNAFVASEAECRALVEAVFSPPKASPARSSSASPRMAAT